MFHATYKIIKILCCELSHIVDAISLSSTRNMFVVMFSPVVIAVFELLSNNNSFLSTVKSCWVEY